MRLLLLLPLVACTDKDDYTYDTGLMQDTGLGVCGKVRGTTGVLMYERDDNNLVVLPPEEAPDHTSVTTGVAGPFDSGVTWLAITDGDVIRSDDMGCNWASVGALPAGDWGLVRASDDVVYAFDRASSAGARSDDLGLTWDAFDTSEPFVALPTVDATNPDRLRGVQSRGVVTSDDGGASWPVSGSFPSGLVSAPNGASASEDDLDRVVISGPNGAWRSFNGGTSWDPFYSSGDGYAVAIHPDDADIVFLVANDTDGALTAWRYDGSDWRALALASQIEMDPTMGLWPVPGDTSKTISAWGPVPNNDGDPSLALYEMTAETGTKTTRVTMYFHLHQLGFADDRWVAAVDSIEAR